MVASPAKRGAGFDDHGPGRSTRRPRTLGGPPRASSRRGGVPLDHITASFVDGLGAAAATSGILTQQQARIFALLYLETEPLSLDDIASGLDQSKSNISINIRVLVDWHLVRRKPVAGSRKDHYVAATDFFRAIQEIFERRFRWTVRQVLSAVKETEEEVTAGSKASGAKRARAAEREHRARIQTRLAALHDFFSLIDLGIGAFVRGEPFPAQKLKDVASLSASTKRSS